MIKMKDICPVCAQTELGDYWVCEVCGWENEDHMYDPDEKSLPNKMSLNEAKRIWSIGEGFDKNFPHPNQING
jgi:ribosomal protein L37AE/L43A